MNVEQLAQTFWRDGYLILEGFFDPVQMDEIQDSILQYFGDSPTLVHNQEFLNKSATEVIPWFPQQEGVRIFDQVDEDPRLFALSQAILGDGWRALYCMAMFSEKGTKGQAWHQDCPPEDPGKFNLNRLVYSMDVGGELGGEILVMPGSHKRGELTVGDVNEDFAEQAVVAPKKGTLILVHGHTWHRVLPIKGEYRVSTNFRAIPKDAPEDITDVCVYRNMRYQFSTSTVLVDREQC